MSMNGPEIVIVENNYIEADIPGSKQYKIAKIYI